MGVDFSDEDDEDDAEPSSGGANIVLLRAGAVATLAAIIVAAVIIVVSTSGGGGSEPVRRASSHPAPAPAATITVTTTATIPASTASTASTGSTRLTRTRSSSPTSSGTAGAGAGSADSGFVAIPPAGFAQVENLQNHGTYVESRWQHGAEYTLVDMSPRSGLAPEQAAAGVIRTTSVQPGYQEVNFGPGPLAHGPSAQWIFKLPGTERADFFFSRCGKDFGVLGVSTPADFAARLPAFAAFANSVRGPC